MPPPRQLIHSEWFDHALAKLGNLSGVDDLLAEEFYRIACFADLVPVVPGCRTLRVYQTREIMRRDGHVIRILIYFSLRERGRVVNLQLVETVEMDMTGRGKDRD